LAVGFGRKVRNLVDTEVYHETFPDLKLAADSKAAGRWNTSKGGDYFAIGVGGAVTGKGADVLIIDDPHSEQEAALAEVNPDIYDKAYEWYTSGPRQRLQPGGAIIVVMTRWSKRDLTGQILKDAAANDSLDEWEVIEFPAILPSGNPLWPEFWELSELEKVKRDVPNSKWMAQYQQNPVSESAAIVKREWWREWESDNPPSCDFVLQVWDTAFEKTSRADYSACTTWGVFYHPDDSGETQANIILLNAFRDRMEFPELKRVAVEEYKEWQPDGVIIEKKASGAPLIYEMRAMGIPVQDFTPTRGNDKISRLNGVADIFASGRVWAPGTRWAEEVIDEVAEFPAGSNDDYVDTVSMALHRFRRGGYVTTNLDEPDDIVYFRSNRNQGYY
jgi:predicted phage terminase large subunit-like protein